MIACFTYPGLGSLEKRRVLKSLGISLVFLMLSLSNASADDTCSAATDSYSWKPVSPHICNKSLDVVELRFTRCYRMRVKEPLQRWLLKPGVCATPVYSNRMTQRPVDRDNAATIEAHTISTEGYRDSIGKITLQGLYTSDLTSCADLKSGLTQGWQLAGSVRSCWRWAASNYGANAELRSPAEFDFLDERNKPVKELSLEAEVQGTLYLRNRGNYPAILTTLNLAGLEGFNTSDCPAGKTLEAHSTCPIPYSIPRDFQTGSYSLTANGTNTSSAPISANLNINITGADGHFIFIQGGQEISSLDLYPRAQGSIAIQNTGSRTISGMRVNIPDALQGQISDACTSTTPEGLQPTKTCQLNYQISANTSADEYLLSVSGTGANNSPHTLTMDISNQGHLVFRQNGADVTSLTVVPGDDRTLELHNIGKQDLRFSLSVPSWLEVTGSPCDLHPPPNAPQTTPLGAQSSCTINYQVPPPGSSTVPAPGPYTLTVSSAQADNSPVSLDLTVAGTGYLVVEQNGVQLQNLNMVAGGTGSIRISNRGTATVTNFNLVLPSSIASYFSGTCKTSNISIETNAFCNLDYSIPSPLPHAGDYTLTLTGVGAANSGTAFDINLAAQGHLVFIQNRREITNLDLAAGASGKIKIRNTGGARVTGFSVTIPPAIKQYFSGHGTTCIPTRTTIGVSSSCNIFYAIPSDIEGGDYTIRFTGQSVGNSDNFLPIQIAGIGHLFFRQHGRNISDLTLVKGDSRFVQLINTGTSNITLNPLQWSSNIGNVLFYNLCANSQLLKSGQSCTIYFALPTIPTAPGDYTLIATATDLNNKAILDIHIPEKGHFYFEQYDKKIRNVVFAPNTSGSIQLTNVGPSSIQGVSLNIPEAIRNYFLATSSCLDTTTTITTLAPRDNCTLNYSVPANPAELTQSYTITARGTNANNSGVTITVLLEQPTFIGVGTGLHNPQSVFCEIGLYYVRNCQHNNLPSSISGVKNAIFNAGQNLAFVDTQTPGQLARCRVDPSNGTFSQCQNVNISSSLFSKVTDLVLSNDESRIFILSQQSSITTCQVSGTGQFSGCKNVTVTVEGVTGIAPRGMALSADNTLAVITDVNGHTVIVCNVSITTGDLSSCSKGTQQSLSTGNSIAFNATTDHVFLNTITITTISHPHLENILQEITICDFNKTTKALSNCGKTSYDHNFTRTGGLGIYYPEYYNDSGTIIFRLHPEDFTEFGGAYSILHFASVDFGNNTVIHQTSSIDYAYTYDILIRAGVFNDAAKSLQITPTSQTFTGTPNTVKATHSDDVQAQSDVTAMRTEVLETGPVSAALTAATSTHLNGEPTARTAVDQLVAYASAPYDNAQEANAQEATVQWSTLFEHGTVGFHLERYDPAAGTFTRLHHDLLPGDLLPALVHSHTGGVYRFVDRAVQAGDGLTYRLVAVDGTGHPITDRQYTVTVAADASSVGAQAVGAQAISEGHWLTADFARMERPLDPSHETRQAARLESRARASAQRLQHSGPVVKVITTEPGLYRLEASAVAAAMGHTVDHVQQLWQRGLMALRNNGQRVATRMAEDASALLFYAQPLDTP
ncbi:MAG: beta-propeller fold lactonase family protein [Gammaproteobacteria bacterium]|nr:beta-propeller fold lactonase family protein [Gammaproteobacteria bacterium]